MSSWSGSASASPNVSAAKFCGKQLAGASRNKPWIATIFGVCALGSFMVLILGYFFLPSLQPKPSPLIEIATRESQDFSKKTDDEFVPASPNQDEIASHESKSTTTALNLSTTVNAPEKPVEVPIEVKRTVVISSDPPGANIYLDDQLLPTRTNAEVDLAPGRYRLRLMDAAFTDPPETEVLIEAGEGKQVLRPVKLEPLVVFDADYTRGIALFWGIGTQIDQTAGINCLLKSAERNHPLAMGHVAWFYYQGNHQEVSKDRQEAAKWAQRAHSRLQKLAANGDSQAQRLLGQIYNHGIGVQQDQVLAVEWFRKAAEQNLPMAQGNLAANYEYGQGVPQDYAEAAAWFRKAADQNLALAQNNLARLYQQGLGVTKDPVEAAAWYRKAAEQNLASAQNNLGRIYQQGLGVTKDPVEAAVWYRKAADQNLALAQNHLGWMYQHGVGVTKSPTEAADWYRKVIRNPNATETEKHKATERLTSLGEVP